MAVISHPGGSFEAESGETILAAGLRAGVGLQYECASGGCGACRVKLLSGNVHHLWPDNPVWNEADKKRGRILSCQTVADGDCAIQVIDDPDNRTDLPPRRIAAVVTALRHVTHDMIEVTLRSGSPARFLAGQFAVLNFAGMRRSYSMSNLPNDAGDWAFVIRRVPGGAFSDRITCPAVVGQRVDVEAPYGAAYLRDTGRDVICLAGGSGLAPMLSIARGFAADPSFAGRRLEFILGARQYEDLAFGALLAEIGAIAPHVSVSARLSGTPVDGCGWDGARGMIDQSAIDHIGQAPDAHDIYLAGPPVMIDAVVAALVAHGVSQERIHVDRFY